MRSLFFWRNWPTDYRLFWFLISAVFIFSICFMWFGYFQGTDGVISWEKIQEQKIIETTVHAYRLGPFTLSVPGESYVIFEYLQGSDLHHNVAASLIFLVVTIICSLILLTIITTLDKFWFFTGMALFILFVVSLRLDVLHLFGLKGIIVPAGILLLFISLSFYFKSIRPHTSFLIRVFSFFILAGICAAAIAGFSEIQLPFLQLAVTAYLPALVLSVLFIVMVAHEIVAAFIPLTSQRTKSLRHFYVHPNRT